MIVVSVVSMVRWSDPPESDLAVISQSLGPTLSDVGSKRCSAPLRISLPLTKPFSLSRGTRPGSTERCRTLDLNLEKGTMYRCTARRGLLRSQGRKQESYEHPLTQSSWELVRANVAKADFVEVTISQLMQPVYHVVMATLKVLIDSG